MATPGRPHPRDLPGPRLPRAGGTRRARACGPEPDGPAPPTPLWASVPLGRNGWAQRTAPVAGPRLPRPDPHPVRDEPWVRVKARGAGAPLRAPSRVPTRPALRDDCPHGRWAGARAAGAARLGVKVAGAARMGVGRGAGAAPRGRWMWGRAARQVAGGVACDRAVGGGVRKVVARRGCRVRTRGGCEGVVPRRSGGRVGVAPRARPRGPHRARRPRGERWPPRPPGGADLAPVGGARPAAAADRAGPPPRGSRTREGSGTAAGGRGSGHCKGPAPPGPEGCRVTLLTTACRAGSTPPPHRPARAASTRRPRRTRATQPHDNPARRPRSRTPRNRPPAPASSPTGTPEHGRERTRPPHHR
ncbi:hypothetical protein J3A78_002841 [Streptomyces sp. PvR006]|nr:hypothetical protein [Streptomyces sp. PvR006]